MTSKRLNRGRNSQLAFMLFAAIMMFAVAANAESAKTQHRGTLNIKTETVVQGVTLPVGDYEVRELKTEQGPAIEFVRKYWNEAASEMVQAEEDQLVARVPVVEQPTNERPAHTKLELSADNKTATALEIRKVAATFVFEGTETASHPVAPANSVSATE